MSNRKQYKREFEAKVKALHAKLGELTVANGAGNPLACPKSSNRGPAGEAVDGRARPLGPVGCSAPGISLDRLLSISRSRGAPISRWPAASCIWSPSWTGGRDTRNGLGSWMTFYNQRWPHAAHDGRTSDGGMSQP